MILDAWLYGTHVARVRRHGETRAHVDFTEDALDRWGTQSWVVSGLLPLTTDPPGPTRSTAWLMGLLPEGSTRTELALRAGVRPDDPVGFLAAYGRDTAGALVLVREGEEPEPPGTLTRISEPEIAALLDQARTTGAADQVASLTGLETKIVLTRTNEGWARPEGRPPSTHILKLGRPSDSLAADLIHTAAAAMDLGRRCHLTTVSAEVTRFSGLEAIVVERYDRTALADGTVHRIHQEDAAQLLGLDTTDPLRKFGWGRTLPSLRAIARRLVDIGADDPSRLLALTTFNVAIGNADAHAKNISIIHRSDGSSALAPAYDVAMHRHHEHAERRFAMPVNGVLETARITAADLIAEGRSWGLPERVAARAVLGTLHELESALADVDRTAHPGVTERAWSLVETRAQTLAVEAGPWRAQTKTARERRRPAPSRGSRASGVGRD